MAKYLLTTLAPDPRLVRAADGAECVRFSKQLGVLIHLALRPEARATRDELVGLLWTGTSQQDGRRGLRQAVYQIRHATDHDFIRGDEMLSLRREDLEVDVDSFRHKLAAQELDGALAVYQADFLSGVDLAGAREFEQWADGIRTVLAAEYRQLLRSLVAREADTGKWSEAAGYAERLIAADPASQETRIRVVELYALSGDAVRARMAAYEARAFADETFGKRGSREFDEAINRALAATTAPERRRTNGFPRNPEMVGRATQFHLVVERWKAAREGKGGGVLVTGDAGIGKTRLVREVMRRFGQDRALVLGTACYAIEQSDPLGPFLELLRAAHSAPGLSGATPTSLEILGALIPEVAERFKPAVRPRTPPVPSQAVAAALLEGFGAIADEIPLALVVDDLHWASPATLEFAHRLARHARAHPLLLLMSARDYSPSPEMTRALRDLATSGDAVLEVALSPLDEVEVTNLVSSIAELTPEVAGCCLAEQLVERTDGIPLYVLEALKELYDTGYLVVRKGQWVLNTAVAGGRANLPLPDSAAEVLKRRLEKVGGTLLDVLVALAVWGREAPAATLARIAGCTSQQADEALAALERRRMVGRRSDSPVIEHDEIARRVLEIAPADLVIRAHLNAATAATDLAAEGKASEWIVAAAHAASAGHGDAAIELAAHAAQDAERTSGEEAGRDTIRRVAAAAPDAERRQIERSFQRVLAARWTVRRWVEERDGTASRRRLRIGALAAVAVILAAAGITTIARGRPTPPPLGGGYIVVTTGEPTTGRGVALALRVDSQFAAESLSRRLLPPGIRDGYPSGAVQPGGRLALTTCSLPNVDPTAICEVNLRTGARRPFFRYEGDADPYAWLPDGADLLVIGGYRSRTSGYSYAVLLVDSSGRLVRTIARDHYSYHILAVSPAGDRFVADRQLGEHHNLVLMNLEGTVLGPLGWCDPATVIAWSPDGTMLACTSARNQSLAVGPAAAGNEHATIRLGFSPRSGPAWSPDGRYVAVALGDPTPGIYVLDVMGAREPRRVSAFGGAVVNLAWVRATPQPAITRVRVVPGSLTVTAGYRFRFDAIALDAAGQPVRGINGIRWASLDPEIVRLIGAGRGVADRPGTARLVASLGLTEADTAIVTVPATPHHILFHETFNEGLDTAVWQPFGYPAPRVLRAQGRNGSPGFNNNGDYSHTSGIALKQPLRVTGGLTVQYWARVPIRYHLWEDVSVGLTGLPADSFFLRRGDPWDGVRRDLVSAAAPNQENPLIPMEADLHGDVEASRAELPPALRDGDWHRYRLVIYPSGEVRWFADGIEITRPAQANINAHPTWTLVVEGQSYRTLAMVDDITVWRGVVLDPPHR